MCQFLLQLMIIFQEFGLYSAHLERFLKRSDLRSKLNTGSYQATKTLSS